jgi:protease-4
MASEHIWRAVSRLAATKPVVVSMGTVAASGGYWVATPAAKIFANDQTLTGSIGIFSLKPDLSGLYELIGVGSEVRKRGEHADWDSAARPMSDDDRAQTRAILEHYHEIFVDRVRTGRELTQDEVSRVATGRVWTGEQARTLGLVDARGGLWDAIIDAAGRAQLGLGDFEVDIQRDSLQGNLMLSVLTGGARSSGRLEEVYGLMQKLRSYDGLPLALMPVQYEVRP